MAHGRQEHHESPEAPANPIEEAAENEQTRQALGGRAVCTRQDCVQDMATVELAGGNQVERGDEEADPSGNEDRVEDSR